MPKLFSFPQRKRNYCSPPAAPFGIENVELPSLRHLPNTPKRRESVAAGVQWAYAKAGIKHDQFKIVWKSKRRFDLWMSFGPDVVTAQYKLDVDDRRALLDGLLYVSHFDSRDTPADEAYCTQFQLYRAGRLHCEDGHAAGIIELGEDGKQYTTLWTIITGAVHVAINMQNDDKAFDVVALAARA